MNNIFFEVDKYEIKQKSRTELNKTVMFLQTNPSVRIEIAGHTDNSGNDSHNRQLSLNRAKAVHQFLIDQGINTKRLTYKGYGSTLPVAPNDSGKNRQLNRRIEFKIL